MTCVQYHLVVLPCHSVYGKSFPNNVDHLFALFPLFVHCLAVFQNHLICILMKLLYDVRELGPVWAKNTGVAIVGLDIL